MELDSIKITCEGRLKVIEVFDVGVTLKNISSCYLPRNPKTGKLEQQKDGKVNDDRCIN